MAIKWKTKKKSPSDVAAGLGLALKKVQLPRSPMCDMSLWFSLCVCEWVCVAETTDVKEMHNKTEDVLFP